MCLELIVMPVLCCDDAFCLFSAKDGQYLISVSLGYYLDTENQ